MSETKEVAVVQSPVDVANSVEGIPAIQGQLAEWSRLKLAEARAEEAELRAAYQEAKAHKWKSSAILSGANKALLRVQYYEKVVAALEAGYMLFPPINNVDVIAIRTTNDGHNKGEVAQQYGIPWGESSSENPPKGEGEYKDPNVKWQRWGKVTKTNKRADGTTYTEQIQNWNPVNEMTAPVFPLVMARVQCVEATNAAMEAKFFDEIAIYPARARKDPVIIGRIHDPRGRWLHFLISWRVDKRDL